MKQSSLPVLAPDVPVSAIPATGLTIEEVSQRYRIPVPTLRKWRRRGHVDGPVGVLVSGQLRYLPEALERFDRHLVQLGHAAILEAEELAAQIR